MYLINKKYRENEKRHNVLTKPISEILRGEHYKYFVELNGFIPGTKLEVIDCPIVINNNDYKDKIE